MNRTPTEYEEQVVFFKWCDLNRNKYKHLNLIHASLNGLRLPIGLAVKAKKQGLKRGLPDVFLPVPRAGYHGLYIEMKRKVGGVVSKEQKEFIEELLNIGYQCHVCKGADEAISAVKNYYF